MCLLVVSYYRTAERERLPVCPAMNWKMNIFVVQQQPEGKYKHYVYWQFKDF